MKSTINPYESPFSYGFPMVFPLKSPFSYGFPMAFPWFQSFSSHLRPSAVPSCLGTIGAALVGFVAALQGPDAIQQRLTNDVPRTFKRWDQWMHRGKTGRGEIWWKYDLGIPRCDLQLIGVTYILI